MRPWSECLLKIYGEDGDSVGLVRGGARDVRIDIGQKRDICYMRGIFR